LQHAHIARRVLEIGKWLALGGTLPVPVSMHRVKVSERCPPSKPVCSGRFCARFMPARLSEPLMSQFVPAPAAGRLA